MSIFIRLQFVLVLTAVFTPDFAMSRVAGHIQGAL